MRNHSAISSSVRHDEHLAQLIELEGASQGVARI
jgi:hypothetical protein